MKNHIIVSSLRFAPLLVIVKMPAIKNARLLRAAAAAAGRKAARRALIDKKRRNRLKRPKNNVYLGLGFPKKVTVTHKYNETVIIPTGTLGTMSTYNFTCNGMYDPNASSTGHQPMYFDQLSALYDHYTVIGSKITVTFSNQTGVDGNNRPCTVGILITDDGVITGNVNTLKENGYAKWKWTGSLGYEKAIVTNKWSAKKTFGGSILGNDNLQGTPSVNPTELSYFTLFVDSSQSAIASSVVADVTITYIAVWDELKEVASS